MLKPRSYIVFFILLIGLRQVNVCGKTGNENLTLIPVQENQDTLLRNELKRFESFLSTSRRFSPQTLAEYNYIVERFENRITTDSLALSDYYYLTAGYNLVVSQEYDLSQDRYHKFIAIREMYDSVDLRYLRALSNLCDLYSRKGELERAIKVGLTALKQREDFFDTESSELIPTLLTLSAAYNLSYQYDKSLSHILRGIELVESHSIQSTIRSVMLYYNAGNTYKEILDYSTALKYYSVALDIMSSIGSVDLVQEMHIYNGIAVCYRSMGSSVEALEYFQYATNLIELNDIKDPAVSVIYSNFAYFLAASGEVEKATELIRRAVNFAELNWGRDSKRYLEDLEELAYFTYYYLNDFEESEKLFSICFEYTQENFHDFTFYQEVTLDYSRMLMKQNKTLEPLILLDSLLADIDHLKRQTLVSVYNLRSDILAMIYSQSGDINTLKDSYTDLAAAISVIEENRLEINAEESRARITARYGGIYGKCLQKLSILHSLTGDDTYINQAFIYSEKSKAASLLLSQRAASAVKYHIPDSLANYESELNSKLNVYEDQFFQEIGKPIRNDSLVQLYDRKRLDITARRDSLIRVFEKEYPQYYSLAHSTETSGIDDVRQKIGRKDNFIEYYYGDTSLYIFLVNRRESRLITEPIDSTLRENIIEFRNAILDPAINAGATRQFNIIVDLGNKLYKKMIAPVEPYLLSDRLVIVPDDILYYIPFESFVKDTLNITPLNYRTIPFALKSFDIVYAYSGSILTETNSPGRSLVNRALVFAPEYDGNISVDSILLSRQPDRVGLRNIQGAKQEAIYVHKLLGGRIFIDSLATEGCFKYNSGSYNIIHLAMHTILNDEAPMYSKMIFALESNKSIENGALNTYEVYDLELQSKMVFLSSCNTGSGYLQYGEGVMSLARGFFYSGAPSVVMSLWEVDDGSGKEIVQAFYDNLKRGLGKSKSLRRARIDYLKDADQTGSHPYFWSTLVVMGDDSPIFIPYLRWLLFIVLLSGAIFIARKIFKP